MEIYDESQKNRAIFILEKKNITFELCINIYDYLENPNYNFKMKIILNSLPASIDAITKII